MTTQRPFDPYHRWLGIPPPHQPPDHYRLLGLVRFEDDIDVIQEAAERQMSHVLRHAFGPQHRLAQRLLNELASAKACLCDPLSKQEYDQSLRQSGARRAGGQTDDPAATTPRVCAVTERRNQGAASEAPETGCGGSGPWRVMLRVTAGPHKGCEFVFTDHDTLVAGRDPSVQLCLDNDRHFSRHHFRLEIHPPVCYLVDLNSRNGTFVNGQRVQEAFPEDGDTISGGKTKIVVTVASDSSRTQDFVPQSEKPVAESTSAQSQQNGAPPSETRFVCRVGGYEIQRELGRGATGIVHQAIQTATGRKVALKIIVPVHADNQRAMQTFVREGSTLSQLDHPRIVRFYEMGIADGQLFLAMEYVDTLDFRALLRDGSKAARLKIACGIICQVLDALAYAHSRSLIHRDVKPSNILLTRVGRKLRTKLSDFGLAKNYLNAGLSGITPDAVAIGSLAYMAPEQIISARDAKPTSDIYGAGATLYHYLSGQPPFEFPRGQSAYRVVLQDEPTPLQHHRSDLPSELTRIVHRALEKDPGSRFESAKDMRRALLPFAKGEHR